MANSKLLDDLASEVDKGFIEDTFEVRAHKFKMRLLSDGEANWKNRFIDGLSSSMALLSSRRAPTLAIAIQEVDGQSVQSMFMPEEADALEQFNRKTTLEKQFFAAEKLFNWISKRPSDFTGELYDKYFELEQRRDEVQKNLKKS